MLEEDTSCNDIVDSDSREKKLWIKGGAAITLYCMETGCTML
jgi:hypothetical protein